MLRGLQLCRSGTLRDLERGKREPRRPFLQAPNPSSSGRDGGNSPSSGDQPLGLSRRGASVFPLAWADVMQDKDLGGDSDGRRGSSKPARLPRASDFPRCIDKACRWGLWSKGELTPYRTNPHVGFKHHFKSGGMCMFCHPPLRLKRSGAPTAE